ncbi:reverse transcriptase domain protein, partial [Colletotrichum incanum]
LDQSSGILERKHNAQLDKLERRLPHVVPPWTPRFVCINESAADAIKEHDGTEPEVVRIYTDGSGINGHIGAAAVITNPPVDDIGSKRLEYIGTSVSSTVYAAELKGLALALQMILDIHKSSNRPANALPIRALEEVRSRGWEVQFRWIPAHVGVPGNELADQAAKEAAGFSPNADAQAAPPPEPEHLRTLTVTTKTIVRRTMKHEWDLYKLGARPGKSTPDIHNGTHRA